MLLGIRVMISNNRAFTLIEFLVALVILSVGLLGLLKCIDLAMEKNLDNIYRTEAVMLADDRMMLIRSTSFASLATTAANPPKILLERGTRGIFRNYSVQEIVTQSTPNSKEIVINVSWKKKGKSFFHSISSYVSKF
jgi:type IV pilus assembly protein PilV